jgi:hypothetical protein
MIHALGGRPILAAAAFQAASPLAATIFCETKPAPPLCQFPTPLVSERYWRYIGLLARNKCNTQSKFRPGVLARPAPPPDVAFEHVSNDRRMHRNSKRSQKHLNITK